MFYDFRCNKCGQTTEKRLSVAERLQTFPCDVTAGCSGTAAYSFNPEGVHFVLGGAGWPSKDIKEKRYRAERSQLMGEKMRDNVKPTTLIPNFQGQVTETWADAKAAAHDASRTSEQAIDIKSYDALVSKEQQSRIASKTTTVATA